MVDFDEIRKRLQRSLAQLDTNLDEASTERILRERAQQFASLRAENTNRHVVAESIIVRRADSLLAFPIVSVAEVREVTVCRLPGGNRHICGLFQLRGQIHSLVDLQPFVGATEELHHQEHTAAILVECAHGTLGVRVDEVLDPRTIYTDELDSGRRERRLEFVSHVTRDCVELIDIEALFDSQPLRMSAGRDTHSHSRGQP